VLLTSFDLSSLHLYILFLTFYFSFFIFTGDEVLQLPSNSTNDKMVSKIRAEAISVFISGFDIFMPKKNDQILLLECLINKKKNSTSSINREGKVKSMITNNSSVIKVIDSISPVGLDELLLAVLQHTASPVIAWNSLHPSLQRNTNCGLSFSTSAKIDKVLDHRKGNKYVTSSTVSSILPVKIGDVVARGHDWVYGQQDQDARTREGGKTELSDVSVGYITGVSLWDPMTAILSPGTSSFSPMQNERGTPWELNSSIGAGIGTGKGDDKEREKDKGVVSTSSSSTVKKQEGGSRDVYHRGEQHNSEDREREEEEEAERGGLCVTVQWTHGGVNTYRWGVPIEALPLPLSSSSPLSSSPLSAPANPGGLSIKTSERVAVLTQTNVVDRYYDVKILALDSEPVEVRRQAQVRTLKHAQPLKEVLKYTPGQVHDSLVRGMGDIQAGDVLQYVRDRDRVALSTATTVAAAATSATPTTPTATAAAAAVSMIDGIVVQTGGDSEVSLRIETVEGEISGDSTSNAATAKDVSDKVKEKEKDKDKDKTKDENNKDRDEDKNGSKNDAPSRSSWTPSEIYQIYENYFSRHGIILPVDFSMFPSTNSSQIAMERDTMSDAFSRLMISLTQLIEAIHVSQCVSNNSEKIQISETKEIGEFKNAQNTDIVCTNMDINTKITESAQRALLLFQGLILGAGESPAGKNLSKINIRANEIKHRLANKEFIGSEKVPLKWNWTEGFWNFFSKDSDRKKNLENTTVYEKGKERILTNLLFDSTCVPESLVLSESRRTVHQRWNKRWGSAVGNIVLHPNTGDVMRMFM
jgi:hypothetical protein